MARSQVFPDFGYEASHIVVGPLHHAASDRPSQAVRLSAMPPPRRESSTGRSETSDISQRAWSLR